MYQIRFGVPENEWLRVIAAAREMWADEKVTNAELARRCLVLGARTLRYLKPDSARMFVQTYRNYQPPFDGNGAARPTTPSEAEGDPR